MKNQILLNDEVLRVSKCTGIATTDKNTKNNSNMNKPNINSSELGKFHSMLMSEIDKIKDGKE